MRKRIVKAFVLGVFLCPVIILSGNAQADINNEFSEYTKNIRQKIINNINYPQQMQEETKRRIITVSFTIDKEGNVERAGIIKSSGSEPLDNAIIKSVYHAGPFPSPVQAGRKSLQLTFSLELIPSRNAPQQSKKNLKDYRNWFMKKVESVLTYPPAAKRQKWEGIATLKVKINNSGTVEEVKVASSSGYPILDKAAVEAVYHASPYPFPTFINQTPLTLTVPFNFSLRESFAAPKPQLESVPKQSKKKTKTAKPSLLQSYIYKVREKITKAMPCPSQITGQKEIVIQFTINNKGKIEKLTIKKSSGSNTVDEAVKEAVYKAGPFPFPLPENKDSIRITLPLQFKPQVLKTTPKLKPPSEKLSKKQNIKSKLTSEHKKQKKSYINSLPKRNDNMYMPEGREELKTLIKIAIQNSKPLEIASEEMKLANIKLTEAKRNLWPSTTLGFYHTGGETYKLDYREQEGKITVNQPLYYGGQLTNAIKQADVNIEINRRNYLEKKIDVINKTEVAYFNLIALYQNMEGQKEIVDKSQKILQIIDKQYKNGLVIKLDYNEAHSWHKQLTLQLKSIKQEKDLARLSLKQALNTEDLPPLTNFSIGIKEFNFTLDECIRLALKYRPEMELGKLMVKFYDYARKVEEGKEKFRVDMTGSCGYYQGGYETEPLKPASNWSIGIKVTKPWGPNTLTSAYNTNNQQPRFGETSPTKTSTLSTELKVFDNYKMKANLENAKIMYLKSVSQLQETKKSIAFEVKNDFFKYKKALLQLKSSLSQKHFREEELKITQQEALSGEAKFVHLMEILVQLADAKNKYSNALGNYYIAIANLKKATGYGLHIPLM